MNMIVYPREQDVVSNCNLSTYLSLDHAPLSFSNARNSADARTDEAESLLSGLTTNTRRRRSLECCDISTFRVSSKGRIAYGPSSLIRLADLAAAAMI